MQSPPTASPLINERQQSTDWCRRFARAFLKVEYRLYYYQSMDKTLQWKMMMILPLKHSLILNGQTRIDAFVSFKNICYSFRQLSHSNLDLSHKLTCLQKKAQPRVADGNHRQLLENFRLQDRPLSDNRYFVWVEDDINGISGSAC